MHGILVVSSIYKTPFSKQALPTVFLINTLLTSIFYFCFSTPRKKRAWESIQHFSHPNEINWSMLSLFNWALELQHTSATTEHNIHRANKLWKVFSCDIKIFHVFIPWFSKMKPKILLSNWHKCNLIN